MKETKEIVENILQIESSDYDLADSSEIVTSGKTIQIMRHEENETNILPHDTEELLEDCPENEEIVDEECISLDDMETYEPCQEIETDFNPEKLTPPLVIQTNYQRLVDKVVFEYAQMNNKLLTFVPLGDKTWKEKIGKCSDQSHLVKQYEWLLAAVHPFLCGVLPTFSPSGGR